jgi:hypothetical protein
MEKLKIALDKLDSSKKNIVCSALSIAKTSSKPKILQTITTLTGLTTLLSTLSDSELAVIHLLSKDKNGLIFSDIEKALKVTITEIESLTEKLQDMLLLYVLKNRKHLNNRFDKAYIYPVLFDILDSIKGDYHLALKHEAAAIADSSPIKDKNRILGTIYSAGSVISLKRLEEVTEVTQSKLNATLLELHQEGSIYLYSIYKYPFTVIVVLTKLASFYFAQKNESTEIKISVHNGYTLLLNILHSYDVIKSSGLYFTQQFKFRKTDLKKLLVKMIPLTNSNGEELSEDQTLQLALYFLNILDCTKITKTNIFVSLSAIRRFLHSPAKLTEILIKNITKPVTDENFEPPILIPSKNHVDYIIKKIRDTKVINISSLQTEFFYYFISKLKDLSRDIDSKTEKLHTEFNSSIDFLLLLGVIKQNANSIEYIEDYEHHDSPSNLEPSIYINPDFSLIIPKNETPPYIQYLVLAFSTVIKNDVTINSHITKEAVLNAYKRGMKAKVFTETLENFAKNELPQNMTFLIHEWIKQSLNINVTYGTILEVNHQSFIDELEFKHPDTILRRLSDTCAIVSVDTIDDIVKLGEKHKALIRIDTA